MMIKHFPDFEVKLQRVLPPLCRPQGFRARGFVFLKLGVKPIFAGGCPIPSPERRGVKPLRPPRKLLGLEGVTSLP